MNKQSWKRRAKQAERYAEALEQSVHIMAQQINDLAGEPVVAVPTERQENWTLERANDKPE